MYAIKNTITQEWLYGTDFREYPYKQRTSYSQALTFSRIGDAEYEFDRRRCGTEYRIAKVSLIEVGG